MDIKKQEELFLKFQPMIKGKARKFSNVYLIEHDEILSESYLIFVETCSEYDEKKSCFSTYLYNMLEMKLNTFCKKNRAKYVHTDVLDTVISYSDNFIEGIFLDEIMDGISNLSREIIELIFNNEKVTNEKSQTKWRTKVTKKYIENYFMKKGISRAKIRNSFDEIQGILC